LGQVLRVYVQHYNRHRPHRALGLESPDPATSPGVIGNSIHSGCADVTCSAASSTSTDKLHQRIYAPYGLIARCNSAPQDALDCACGLYVNSPDI
jgi:hypothetical protein